MLSRASYLDKWSIPTFILPLTKNSIVLRRELDVGHVAGNFGHFRMRSFIHALKQGRCHAQLDCRLASNRYKQVVRYLPHNTLTY